MRTFERGSILPCVAIILAGCASPPAIPEAPWNYHGIDKAAVLFQRPASEIAADCDAATREPFGIYAATACTIHFADFCIIYMPRLEDAPSPSWWNLVYKHEKQGHCDDDLVHGSDGRGWYTLSGERVG